MAKIELIGGHIWIMLIIEIEEIELTGSHIEIMLIIESGSAHCCLLPYISLYNLWLLILVWVEPIIFL